MSGVNAPAPLTPVEPRPWYHWRRTRGALATVGLLFAVPGACEVAWRLRHPAPLGRSQAAVDRTLARDLPAGTPVEDVTSYLARHGLDFVVDSSGGQRTVAAAARNVDSDVFVTKSVGVQLEFDAAWRLRRVCKVAASG